MHVQVAVPSHGTWRWRTAASIRHRRSDSTGPSPGLARKFDRSAKRGRGDGQASACFASLVCFRKANACQGAQAYLTVQSELAKQAAVPASTPKHLCRVQRGEYKNACAASVGLVRSVSAAVNRSNLRARVHRQEDGAPDRIRTCDLWLRRPTLYPTELRAPGWCDPARTTPAFTAERADGYGRVPSSGQVVRGKPQAIRSGSGPARRPVSTTEP